MENRSRSYRTVRQFVEFIAQGSDKLSHDESQLTEAGCLRALLVAAYPALEPKTAWQKEALSSLLGSQRVTSSSLSELRIRFERASTDDETEFSRNLKQILWLERVRIALLEVLPSELGGKSVQATSAEWSDVAQACLEVAVKWSILRSEKLWGTPLQRGGAPSQFVLFALGKLGARELNPGSDVDICFFYDTADGKSTVPLSVHWTRTTQQLIAILDKPTEDGILFRVDTRLRPFGRQGPLCSSVAAAEQYFETWGRLWERAAWVRGRAIAGSPALGALIANEILQPFVFRKEVVPAILPRIRAYAKRVPRRTGGARVIDLKHCQGGIRDAEYFVNGLQLLWGGNFSTLRVGNTWTALQRLEDLGLVSAKQAERVASGYAMLRTLEHRVQLATGIRTHCLPNDLAQLGALARSMDCMTVSELHDWLQVARTDISQAVESLDGEGSETATRYRSLFDWFDDPSDTTSPGESADRLETALPTWVVPAAVQNELAERGLIGDSVEFAHHLLVLALRPDSLLGEKNRQDHPTTSEGVVDALVSAADPEQAVRYLRLLLSKVQNHNAYVSSLLSRPGTLNGIVAALGSSAFIGNTLLAHPEMIEGLLQGLKELPSPLTVFQAEMMAPASPDAVTSGGDMEPWVSGQRRAKKRVLFETAAAELTGAIDRRTAQRRLSNLADLIIGDCTERALGADVGGFCVIALGKLGGEELGYGSDLDLLFVYDAQRQELGAEGGRHAIRCAQRIIRQLTTAHPTGPGYVVDFRLRPWGGQGVLVTSVDAFSRYHGYNPCSSDWSPTKEVARRFSSAWERQSLLRARFCAGDAGLGNRVTVIAERLAYESGAASPVEFAQMRERIRSELSRESEHRRDLKYGRGGLLDVEFAVQHLQMQHGHDRRVRASNIEQALNGLRVGGYISQTDYTTLQTGYEFLRDLEQRLHILHASHASVIDARAEGFRRLARRLGIYDGPRGSSSEILMGRYVDVTSKIQAALEGIFSVQAVDPT